MNNNNLIGQNRTSLAWPETRGGNIVAAKIVFLPLHTAAAASYIQEKTNVRGSGVGLTAVSLEEPFTVLCVRQNN